MQFICELLSCQICSTQQYSKAQKCHSVMLQQSLLTGEHPSIGVMIGDGNRAVSSSLVAVLAAQNCSSCRGAQIFQLANGDRFIFSNVWNKAQNHRIIGFGRDLWRSCSSTPCKSKFSRVGYTGKNLGIFTGILIHLQNPGIFIQKCLQRRVHLLSGQLCHPQSK